MLVRLGRSFFISRRLNVKNMLKSYNENRELTVCARLPTRSLTAIPERKSIMKIHIIGKDERLKVCAALLEEKPPPKQASIMLLPIPVSRDGEHITGTEKNFSELLNDCEPGEALVAYAAPKKLRELASEKGALLLDPERDEEYVAANALLTAIGTLGRILTEERRAPCQLSIGVIGYGRIGQSLVRLLMFLGAEVKVFTSKAELRRDLQMLGISGVDSCALSENYGALLDLDILINTAPVTLLAENAAKALSHTRVIELASGKNIPDAIPHEIWSAIPANMYPVSAARELYASVVRMLN